MNLTLTQVVALASRGRAWLGTADSPPELYPAHPAFAALTSLSFDRPQPSQLPPLPADMSTTGSWYAALREQGAVEIGMTVWSGDGRIADHIGVSFMGYELWGVVVRYAELLEVWVPHYEPVKLTMHGHVAGPRPPLPAFDHVYRNFGNVLMAAQAFAAEVQEHRWAEVFGAARALLDPATPLPPDPAELLPDDGYSAEARRLLAAARSAYVFGGMGSWNDLGFEGAVQERYDRLSRDLFGTVLIAIASAVNSPIS